MATAVVTGGRGVGRAIANRLARNEKIGSIVILSKTLESAEAAAHEVAQTGKKSFALCCDISDAEKVETTIEQIVKDVGHISYLVNSAGVLHDSLLVRAKSEVMRENVDVNLLGPMFMCRAVVKDMMRSRVEGSILNIGSVVGTQGNAGQTVYSACKAGLVGFTKSLAREMASRKIRVNLLEPGYIETDMTARLDRAKITPSIPLGRFGQPQEVAALAEFVLVNDDASYITGQVLRVDGGLV